MTATPESNRRSFIKKLAATSAAVAIGTDVFSAKRSDAYLELLIRDLKPSINDQINIALIGGGIMGVQDTITALQVPGIKLVAVCDLYDGRLADAKTRWGADLALPKFIKKY